MADFNSFVQLELPRRPFVGTDGAPGQILVRSNNPLAVRELIWSDGLGTLQSSIDSLPTFENLAAGRVVITLLNGDVATSTITPTELEALSGISHNIQAQLNNRALLAHTHNVSDIIGLNEVDGGDSSTIFL